MTLKQRHKRIVDYYKRTHKYKATAEHFKLTTAGLHYILKRWEREHNIKLTGTLPPRKPLILAQGTYQHACPKCGYLLRFEVKENPA